MKPSVLIVDDEPNIVVSLEFLMKQAGFDVRVARDGEDAMRAIEHRKPRLVLLDVMMPKRNQLTIWSIKCDRRAPSAMAISRKLARCWSVRS